MSISSYSSTGPSGTVDTSGLLDLGAFRAANVTRFDECLGLQSETLFLTGTAGEFQNINVYI